MTLIREEQPRRSSSIDRTDTILLRASEEGITIGFLSLESKAHSNDIEVIQHTTDSNVSLCHKLDISVRSRCIQLLCDQRFGTVSQVVSISKGCLQKQNPVKGVACDCSPDFIIPGWSVERCQNGQVVLALHAARILLVCGKFNDLFFVSWTVPSWIRSHTLKLSEILREKRVFFYFFRM